ncbi:amidase family protein [Lentibacillus juripiscarius]|uniref:Amidase family protein n=1 Tax=Lentibacillus juripiscarius TaxID=257446 RepID=A0ABW5V4F8_9BACI
MKGLKIAWSPDLGHAAVDPQVRKITEEAVKVFEQLGCHVEEVNPGFKVTGEEFWTLVARDTDLAGLREAMKNNENILGPTTKDFINIEWTAKQLTNAHMLRQEVNIKMRKFMENYDLLLTPTLAVPPFEVGINGPTQIDGKNVSESHWLSFVFPFNMTGQPASNVPAGWTEDGLPIGLQIVGRHLNDATVLRSSAAFETAKPWAHHWPEI